MGPIARRCDNAGVPARVSVLIVDDQAPFRRAANAVVAATPTFEAVAEAANGEEAVELVATLAPALVLMDINMPGMDGIEASRRITADRPGTVVVLLSTYEASDLPEQAAACGAVGYVHKEDFGPAMLQGIWQRHGDAA